jgi:hypothetical protein
MPEKKEEEKIKKEEKKEIKDKKSSCETFFLHDNEFLSFIHFQSSNRVIFLHFYIFFTPIFIPIVLIDKMFNIESI